MGSWMNTHGRTEPWRFYIYKGETLKQFGHTHAEMYKAQATAETYKPETYENLLHKGDMASHMIVAVMKRGANPKIPAIEELASASASVQNVLLGATALGISTMWNTGGMAHKHILKQHLQLEEEDAVLGFIYFGYSDEPAKEGRRAVPLAEKLIVGQ
jgi:nitroreductase